MSIRTQIAGFSAPLGFSKLEKDASIVATSLSLIDLQNPLCLDQSASTVFTGQALKNLVRGGADCVFGDGSVSLSRPGGVQFTSSQTEVNLPLDSAFNLNNIGPTPSAVINLWLRWDSGTPANGSVAIAGYRYSGAVQWSVTMNGSTGVITASCGGSISYSTAVSGITQGVPALVSLVVKKLPYDGAWKFIFAVYVNGGKISEQTCEYKSYAGVYKLADPSVDVAACVPEVGKFTGWTPSWVGRFYRAGVTAFNPLTFDVDAFVAKEWSRNNGRFA